MANNSRASFWEVVLYTRSRNSSPLLYPYALWAVQLVKSSDFSVRFIPALSSTLTVATLLLMIPRLGVSRWAALIAGILATLSPSAIEHARDAREYSVDAFVATVTIVGLLLFLNDRKKQVLSWALLVGPILQYGLVLFGVAVIATASIGLVWNDFQTHSDRSPKGLILRAPRVGREILWPCVFFAAGCAGAFVTLSGQSLGWGISSYLEQSYYQGELNNPVGVLQFLADRNWSMLSYHLSETAVVILLLLSAVLVYRSLKMRRFNAVLTLLAISLAGVSFAALLKLYPLGDIRQNIFLGPIIFLAIGYIVSSAICGFKVRAMRHWLISAVIVVLTLGAVITLIQANPYQREYTDLKQVITILEEQRKTEDAVYVGRYASAVVQFYQRDQTDHYFHGSCVGKYFQERFEECAGDIRRTIGFIRNYWSSPSVQSAGRLFLLFHDSVPIQAVSEAIGEFYGGEIQLESVAGELLYVMPNLRHVASNTVPAEDEPHLGNLVIKGVFHVFIDRNELVYLKRRCGPNNAFTKFSLQLMPVDENDLPEDRKRHGYDRLDFVFDKGAFQENGSCLMRVPIPGYEIKGIKTGQYVNLKLFSLDIWESEWHPIRSTSRGQDF